METKKPMIDDVSTLRFLGQTKTDYPNEGGVDVTKLEKFKNVHPGRDFVVTLGTKEFTSLCPRTGQPDQGEITVKYIPDEWEVESKGLKLYLFSYRSAGVFQESLTNQILTDLVTLVQPKKMTVIGDFNARGGIRIKVVCTYVRDKGVVDEAFGSQDSLL
jgi:7-cyano-7-deazaguanine reductase